MKEAKVLKEGYRMETQEEFKKRHARSKVMMVCGLVGIAVIIVVGLLTIYGGHNVQAAPEYLDEQAQVTIVAEGYVLNAPNVPGQVYEISADGTTVITLR